MLKTATVSVDGVDIEITEVNAIAQIEMLEAQRRMEPDARADLRLAAIACKHCVPSWEGTDILKTQTIETVLLVAQKIADLSENESKNSESVTSEGSSTD